MDMAVNADRRLARRARMPGAVMAALDLGTNNCRLLVARPAGPDFRVIDAFSRVVRLGEGLATATGHPALSERAIERSIRALHVCAAKIRHATATRVRCVATEACRQAVNGRDFVARVHDQTGLALEIISSHEEATLAVSGCAPLLDPEARRALIVDIGGGSTELIWVRLSNGLRRVVIAVHSIDCGVVSLTEQFGGDRFDGDTYDTMVAAVTERMQGFEAAHGIRGEVAKGGVQIVGTSGTVTTVAAVHKGLNRYDRASVDGLSLDFPTIEAVARELRSLDFLGRAAHPCIRRERADLVVAGCAILEAVCALFPVGEIRVADRGVREGILYALMTGNARSAASTA